MNPKHLCSNAGEPNIMAENYQEQYPDKCQIPHKHRRYMGEYTKEEGEIGVSLLYIPLIQINSSKEKTVMPIFEWVDDYEDY